MKIIHKLRELVRSIYAATSESQRILQQEQEYKRERLNILMTAAQKKKVEPIEYRDISAD